MSAPDEIRQLADRLDDHADFTFGEDIMGNDMRAAAVALRHHANLIAAIDDPDELRRVAVSVARDRKVTSAEAERRIGLLTRIAAAVSPPPAPTTCPTYCPTCEVSRPFDGDPSVPESIDCPDPWHQAAT